MDYNLEVVKQDEPVEECWLSVLFQLSGAETQISTAGLLVVSESGIDFFAVMESIEVSAGRLEPHPITLKSIILGTQI